jgi:threonine aldolase
MCALSGLQPFSIDSEDGTFSTAQVRAKLQPDNIHNPRNRVVALENTHNRCGGTIWPLQQLREVCGSARSLGLAVHIDGARLWNACVATGTQPSDWLAQACSVSMCFSKGLGAPVGSAVAGDREFIDQCRFYRKQFGGQMRQAGVLAAAALYAIEHHWPRMAEDHVNAKLLAEMLDGAGPLRVKMPQTNIAMIDIADGLTAADFAKAAAAQDLHVFAIGPSRVRAVTHLDVSTDDVRKAAAIFQQLAGRLQPLAAG